MSVTPITLPLRDGERLTRDEFLRRWEALPNLKFAELIDGIVHLPSPVSNIHGGFDDALGTWAGTYGIKTRGCQGLNNATWLMEKDAPQPDKCLLIQPEYGGQSALEGIYSAGAPELIVEVSYSSSAYDRGRKLRLYQRAGVKEYITALVKEQDIFWLELSEGRYRRIAPDSDGILRSRVFPGLWLNEAALWARDFAGVLRTLDEGMSSPEYAEFVRSLAARKRELDERGK